MLEKLVTKLIDLIRALTSRLKQARANVLEKGNKKALQPLVDGWVSAMKQILGRYALAAFLAGFGEAGGSGKKPVTTLPTPAKQQVAKLVQAQFKYLDNFALEIADDEKEWQAGWEKRAESYADSINTVYWLGKVKMLPVPALPGDMTTACGTRCKCKWDIKKAGNDSYSCKWLLEPGAEHCQGCRVRAEEWNPLKIENGRLVIDYEG